MDFVPAFVFGGVGAVGSSSFAPARCRTCEWPRGSALVRPSGRRDAGTFPVGPEGAAPCRRRGWAPAMQKTQQETAWNTVKVVENSEASEDHRYIVIEVGVTDTVGSLIDSYRVPGQYVQIRQPGAEKPGFFAISCAPNLQGFFEFLVKRSDSSAWFCDIKVGDEVEMGPVSGRGFPIKTGLAGVKDVLLFATGSGIAPIRAAIESPLNGLQPKLRRSTKLYYGCRTPLRMSYQKRFPLWKSDKVEVIGVISQPDLSEVTWTGRTGYVQDALKMDGIEAPEETGALLCGVNGMVDDVRAYLKEQGVREDRILTNF